RHPVLSILIRAHHYLIARYDVDGFRLDTVKYVHPESIEAFGNSMREFALSVGKKNFFTFGEVYDDERTIARFVGRNAGSGEGFGVDSALDFPLFFTLPAVTRGFREVESIRRVFLDRKREEQELLSSHGEAGRYFVSFLDNHDQKERIQHPDAPREQVTQALALMFALQGIPCVYYGTEQGLQGTVHADGSPDLSALESTREALWGKGPLAFDTGHPVFRQIQALAALRRSEPPLRYGRLYFREVSGNGADFGHSTGRGGLVAFSRILVDREILVVANTGPASFSGLVIVDRDINATPRRMTVAYSNRGVTGSAAVVLLPSARFHEDGRETSGPAAALPVALAPGEVQVLVPP
ncbi:MAG TPA: alpha-amylase family glycosyl hydrolase, partial [Vicinamibacteria bacterium]|nr:alpha-amylase family glycosyl hydrolase [Vicinamibacteria bacterium]